MKRAIVDEYMPRLSLQACAATARARCHREKLGKVLPDHGRVRFAVTPFHVGKNTLETMAALDDVAAVIHVGKINPLFATSFENDLLLFFRELLERRFHVERVVLGERTQHVEVIDVAPIPAADRTLCERKLFVVDDASRIEELMYAEAVTGWACAGRVVERKHPRFELADTVAAVGAGKPGRKYKWVAVAIAVLVHRFDACYAIGQL